MTVIQLAAARRQLHPGCWRKQEKTELMRLYAAAVRQHGAADFEFGETDRGEPQFYILDDSPAATCITCASRLSKDSKPWYVIEDGSGVLLSEGYALGNLVERATGRSGWSGSLLVAAPLFDYLLSGWTGCEVEFAVAAQMDVLPPGNVLWWTSHLFALA